MTFGERLKQLMDEKEVTQKEVSENLNIAISTFNGYANDYREPDFSTLISLAKYFDVSADFLLGITKEKYLNTEIDNPDQLEVLVHYYNNMNSATRAFLIEEAKLLSKYSAQLL